MKTSKTEISPLLSLGIDAFSCLLLDPLKMTKENYYLRPFKTLLTLVNYSHIIELGSMGHAFNPSTFGEKAGESLGGRGVGG